MLMEVNEGLKLGSENEQQGENKPNVPTGNDCRTTEHAANMVKMRSVKAGRLIFDLWYEPAQTSPRVSTHIPSRPLASNESPNSSSHMYGTFPSTRVGLDD